MPNPIRWFLFALLIAVRLHPAHSAEAEVFSVYVPAEDGTRLAVDVALPADRAPESRFPALIELTRYWRASENRETGQPNPSLDHWEHTFLDHGYAVVQVDVRGTGASFGTRQVEYGPQEVRDGRAIVDWIVRQPWSDGKVGAHGISYSGTTAELLTSTGHPAIKAVSPGWSDVDTWRSPARPYGLNVGFVEMWGQHVRMLDRNHPGVGGAVKRVDADRDGKLRDAAVKQHAANVDVAPAVRAVDFRDEHLPGTELSFVDISSLRWKKQIEASGVPMLVIASWFDAGSAEGALWRFANFSNPQYIVLQGANHGGAVHASPYTVGDRGAPPALGIPQQVEMRLQFFDHYLKGADNGVDTWPKLRYYNLGQEEFRESNTWPPPGVKARRMYVRAEGLLSAEPPEHEGADRYEVDFGVSTGEFNRWMGQMGQPVLGLDDRGAMDERMLVYTSPPLEEDLQLTGAPWVHLELQSTHADGAVLVYLEDVDVDGRSRYVTEGGLRLLHRQIDADPGIETFGPAHSFAKKSALPMVPGETAEIEIRLNPISVKIARGHRIRLAIAGADAGSFARVPAEGTPTLTVERSADRPTFLELPILPE